jgi:hypothetical protein
MYHIFFVARWSPDARWMLVSFRLLVLEPDARRRGVNKN